MKQKTICAGIIGLFLFSTGMAGAQESSVVRTKQAPLAGKDYDPQGGADAYAAQGDNLRLRPSGFLSLDIE